MDRAAPNCLVLVADPWSAPLEASLVDALGRKLGGAVRWLGDAAAAEIMLDFAPASEVAAAGDRRACRRLGADAGRRTAEGGADFRHGQHHDLHRVHRRTRRRGRNQGRDRPDHPSCHERRARLRARARGARGAPRRRPGRGHRRDLRLPAGAQSGRQQAGRDHAGERRSNAARLRWLHRVHELSSPSSPDSSGIRAIASRSRTAGSTGRVLPPILGAEAKLASLRAAAAERGCRCGRVPRRRRRRQ